MKNDDLLTPEQKELKARVKALHKEIIERQCELEKLIANTPPVVPTKTKPDDTYDGWEDWGTARCLITNQYLGWYCPESPDHICYYYSDRGSNGATVTLKGGKVHTLETPSEPRYETEDICLFCGMPEERK